MEDRRRQLRFSDWTDEAIALAHHGLHETRLVGIVAEGLADFADSRIDTVLGINEDFAAPKVLGYFCPGDEIAFAGGEQDEQLHRLAFELQTAPCAPQLEPAAIQPEVVEFENGDGHRSAPRAGSIKRLSRDTPELTNFQ